MLRVSRGTAFSAYKTPRPCASTISVRRVSIARIRRALPSVPSRPSTRGPSGKCSSTGRSTSAVSVVSQPVPTVFRSSIRRASQAIGPTRRRSSSAFSKRIRNERRARPNTARSVRTASRRAQARLRRALSDGGPAPRGPRKPRGAQGLGRGPKNDRKGRDRPQGTLRELFGGLPDEGP